MDTPQLCAKYQESIPESLELWIHTNINRPIKGFEHKQNTDGTLYTKTQQVLATRLQAETIAVYFIGRGKSQHKILEILRVFR